MSRQRRRLGRVGPEGMHLMPSELHVALQNKALAWLANKVTGRGLRGGLEIPIAPGYIVDALAVCDFQYQFEQRYYSELAAPPPSVCVFEAKATLADFQSTFGEHAGSHQNRHVPVGTLHWIVVPRSANWRNSFDNRPKFWGILQERGSGLTELYRPLAMPISDAEYYSICASILWYQ